MILWQSYSRSPSSTPNSPALPEWGIRLIDLPGLICQIRAEYTLNLAADYYLNSPRLRGGCCCLRAWLIHSLQDSIGNRFSYWLKLCQFIRWHFRHIDS